MSASNKLIFSLAQNLTDTEKYQGRINLGTFGMYDVSEPEQSQTVGGGSVNLPYTVGSALHKGLYLLNIRLSVDHDTSSTPSDKAVPCYIYVDMNRSGGGVTPVSIFTNSLTRIESSGSYGLGMTVMLPVAVTDATSFRFNFEFEIGKLPQGTVVDFNADGKFIGNIEPTP